ncbi:patatin-like phospholipase family protein [Schlegelella sp. S2-27]|uniref:Patatin-like phospholipase family protein n=1 Tax=Caldimonas mangrovi TaxID=2944811 RepID=A0ABT0YRF7_9BURK|nr:patatin-like phospholipase family protein [Caldimonas mangrovi]MCM5681223.1 patatin-like phospholipase family protein [Caldimonas mangrovi]
MQALQIYAGPRALQHIRERGLRPRDVRAVAGAAGGPKGLILNHLDRHVFGSWLPSSEHTVHLIGASIGGWRMAAGALADPAGAFERLARDYIHERYEIEPGRRTPSAEQVSRRFAAELAAFFDGQIDRVVAHPRYRLHIVTSRGRHLLSREGRWRTPLGYLGAVLSNAASRKALSAWLERVVFSTPGEALPLKLNDLRHRLVPLDTRNFTPALLASCSIPFVLKAVHDIPGGPPGAYWDGGITDYHLHWNYSSLLGAAQAQADECGGLVLYPHFQQALVPGWLDKAWKARHRATPYLDNVVVLAPRADWVRTLPNAKLPDRQDFKRYGADVEARMRDWSRAVADSERLADEWAQWLARGTPVEAVQPL